ncbi:phospholipase A2 inhibitor and Ly6/PLAUR domain-containing protein [Xenopus laevis]|uniref:Phospholipase A2 inhibitor and Ly6/PLAUR domain-containing protein n=2 Tax=Xenopus laevis TaxID=8355 RepID=A0A8J0T4B2_XENLA|nr:phospholipase A2 inhibitor and Ly6/PLAUR domain-containing protein [Xenopus laevis]
MKRVLIFISFFVFLKAYFAVELRCYECNSSGCDYTSACAEGEVCLTIFSKVGNTVKVADKICGKKEHCGQSFSQLVRGQKETNFTSCCESHRCIPSEKNAFRNGIMCPFCTKEGSMECTPTNYECMGKANVCYTYTAPGRIIRGCGSKELCGDPMNSFITFEDDGGRTNCTEKSTEDSG